MNKPDNVKTRNSFRRKKLARLIASGKPLTAKAALIEVGYSSLTASKKAKDVINHPELQGELRRIGFTEEKAKERLASIMNAPTVYEMITPDNQIRASELALRVFGSFAPEKHVNLNVDTPFKGMTDDELQRIAYTPDHE